MKERLLVLFIASLFLNGCAKFSVIDSTKQLENPKVVNVEFVPIKAEGKETITKGTEKVVDKTVKKYPVFLMICKKSEYQNMNIELYPDKDVKACCSCFSCHVIGNTIL